MREEAGSLGRQLLKELVPTSTQVFAAIVVSIAFAAILQSDRILSKLGISKAAVDTVHSQFMDRFSGVLQSSITSNLALVAFWATIGLVAYLICWGAYNVLVETRNEVTIETQYTNRGHWRGPWETLALKASACSLLVIYLTNFRFGLSLWVAATQPLVTEPSAGAVLMAIIGVVGLAVQLYFLLVLVQLTITPWYKPGAFTD